jgi:hypothetical protein
MERMDWHRLSEKMVQDNKYKPSLIMCGQYFVQPLEFDRFDEETIDSLIQRIQEKVEEVQAQDDCLKGNPVYYEIILEDDTSYFMHFYGSRYETKEELEIRIFKEENKDKIAKSEAIIDIKNLVKKHNIDLIQVKKEMEL